MHILLLTLPSAGVGRSGTFCTVHSILHHLQQLMQAGKPLPDIHELINHTVRHIRSQRAGMVQTKVRSIDYRSADALVINIGTCTGSVQLLPQGGVRCNSSVHGRRLAPLNRHIKRTHPSLSAGALVGYASSPVCFFLCFLCFLSGLASCFTAGAAGS